MPTGTSLNLDFLTSVPAGNKQSFPFITGNTPVYDPSLGTFDAYHGGNSDATATNYITPEGDAYHGGTGSADVTTNAYDQLEPNAFGGGYADADLDREIRFSSDAYHGAYSDADFTDNPFDELEPNAYSGANSDAVLKLFVQFAPTATHGVYSDTDFTVPPRAYMETDQYHGGYSDSDLDIKIQFNPEAYLGGEGEGDLETYPGEEIEANGYHGVNAETSFKINVVLEADGEHGGWGEGAFYVPPRAYPETDNYHGATADVVDMATTYALYPEAYLGATADHDLAVTYALYVDAELGGEGSLDLQVPKAPEFEPEASHGHNTGDVYLATTQTLFPRGYLGGTGEVDFTSFPGEEIIAEAYHGGYGEEIPYLSEHQWNSNAYHGGTGDVLDMATTYALYSKGYHGINSDASLILTPPTFDDPTAYAGANVEVIFESKPGAELEADATHGGYAFAYAGLTDYYAQLDLRPIVTGAFAYDGRMKHNHCETGMVDGFYNDSVIRFPWVGNTGLTDIDDLIIEFDDPLENWWDCGNVGAHAEVEFTIYPRLYFDSVGHGVNTEVYLPRKYTGFGPVPDEVLYRDKTYIPPYVSDCDCEPIDFTPGDYLAFEHTWARASLDVQGETQGAWNGAYATAELESNAAPFKYSIGAMTGSVISFVNFESVYYSRFCKGYVLPRGNNVNLEFNDLDEYNCYTYNAKGGAQVEFELECHPVLFLEEQYHSVMVETEYMVVEEPFFLNAYHCVKTFLAGAVEMSPRARGGLYSQCAMEEPDWDGYHGAYAAHVELQVPGPVVVWETPEGCLPNTFIPKDEDGQEDLSQIDSNNDGIPEYFEVPVEHMDYETDLNATCVPPLWWEQYGDD